MAPSAPFSPADYDTALVHVARGEALSFITHSAMSGDGGALAWEATVSFAESLMPLASTDPHAGFLKAYRMLVREGARRRAYPTRALWRICSLEMKRQGRLGGEESLPMDREAFGLDPGT